MLQIEEEYDRVLSHFTLNFFVRCMVRKLVRLEPHHHRVSKGNNEDGRHFDGTNYSAHSTATKPHSMEKRGVGREKKGEELREGGREPN